MKTKRTITAMVAALTMLVAEDGAQATTVAPHLATVSAPDFHVTATFAAPGPPDDLTISIARAPDVATNGAFLMENVVSADLMTTDEIVGGRYESADRINPGTYWAQLDALSFTCDDTASTCAKGKSAVVPFEVPAPMRVGRGLVEVLSGAGVVYLGLRLTPAGDTPTAYTVCWTTTRKVKRCVPGTLDGYSWFAPTTDQLRVRLREMPRRTIFRWYVGGKIVAMRSAATVPR